MDGDKACFRFCYNLGAVPAECLLTRHNLQVDLEPPSQLAWAVTPRRNSTTLSRVFSGLSITRRSSESSEDRRGKFGLTLICDRADPIVDIVFVHGLGGGSRKTWCKGDDPSLYWPKEWLQRDPEFKNVRVYGFGYDSDWITRRDSQLGVHDFGKALLSALLRDPFIGSQNVGNPATYQPGQLLTSLLRSFLLFLSHIAWVVL
jgi:hypothetical protein